MEKKSAILSDLDRATELLQAVADWWEDWTTSANPSEVPDPPIEEIEQFLLETIRKT